MQPEKTKRQTQGPTGLYELFFVNCAHLRGSTVAIYKTVLIIFPLNLQTITITLDVVKWRWEGTCYNNLTNITQEGLILWQRN